MKSIYKIFSLVILIAGLYFLFRSTEITHPPGILAPDSPIQEKIYKINAWIKDNFQFTPIKTFETSARVLSIKFYSNDDMSEFCPVDLALGWNRMSDQMIIDNLEIKQQHRWYVWRADFLKIPVKEVEISSSNVHVIPSNEKIENILDDIVNGNIIKIKGKLVNVNKIGKNFTWKTSTKRDDTGGGACEILWTEEITILK